MKRVVVTGLGVLAPGGATAAGFFEHLCTGRSALARIEAEFAERLEARYAGQVSVDLDRHYTPPQLRSMDRVSRLAVLAARQAVVDAGLEWNADPKPDAGVYLGTGMGGANTLDEGYSSLYREQVERLKPYTVLMVMNNAPAAWIALEYGLGAATLTFSTACSSSSVAIGEAARLIQAGRARVMLAGGAEAPLTFGQIKAWESLRTLALTNGADPAAACKPFAKDRTGFILGEGAGMVVLEEMGSAQARGARVYAEVTGYASTTDAGHLTRPTIAGQALPMRLALADAGLRPEDIGYINAHGTGTLQNDAVETAAIKSVFGAQAYRIPISSTKSMHGHLLGAAGAVEFVVGVLAMQSHTLPPTAHLSVPDPDCDLDYVPIHARTGVPVDAFMSNSFAFGGTNAVLIARHWDE